MTLEAVLSIMGPGLTTVGAGLLAYDVLRAPGRFIRDRRHTARLDEAEQHRDDTVRSWTDAEDGLPAREHEAGMAQIHANFAATVGQVRSAYADADARERDRAFRLAVWGLMLLVLGGAAQTVAAALHAA